MTTQTATITAPRASKWAKVGTARKHGWNAAQSDAGWHAEVLTIDGFVRSPIGFATKKRAMAHAKRLHDEGKRGEMVTAWGAA